MQIHERLILKLYKHPPSSNLNVNTDIGNIESTYRKEHEKV
jgi:hypothetical protein